MSAASPFPSSVLVREALANQLTRSRLRGARWELVSRGVYAPRSSTPRALPDLACSLVPVLPRNSGFGHLTGAALRGWWLPNRLPEEALRSTIFASTSSGVHVQRAGLYVRRSAHAMVEVTEGLPLVSAPEILLELAQDLSLVDLVPLVDAALAQGVSPGEVLAAARPRARGSRLLRRAVTLADSRSESWWESVLRLQHILTGLGPVESQVEIWDDGILVARADLHLVGTNRYPECDGGEHRTIERHRHDLARDKRLHRLGKERYGYSTAEIARQPDVVIRDAEDARGLPHDPRRIRRWWSLARQSTLTGHGRARLLARLKRYQLAANR